MAEFQEDMLFKNVADKDARILLDIMGIQSMDVKVWTKELMQIDPTTYKPDLILELDDERSIWSLENFPNLRVLILNTTNLEQFGLRNIKNCPRLHTLIINGADQTDYYTKSGTLRKRVEYKKEIAKCDKEIEKLDKELYAA